MLKIIRRRKMRLSKLSTQEMIVEAIEKANKQILNQTALIKKTIRLLIKKNYHIASSKKTIRFVIKKNYQIGR